MSSVIIYLTAHGGDNAALVTAASMSTLASQHHPIWPGRAALARIHLWAGRRPFACG
jgi:hypothetical protein